MSLYKRIAVGASGLLAMTLAATAPLAAAEQVKIGYVATMSGPAGVLGDEMVKSFNLALEGLGNKLGGVPAVVLVEDDQTKPQIGLEVTRKLIDRDKVDFVVGPLFTNVIQAVVGGVAKDNFVLIPAGGSSQMAGEGCQPNVFVVGWNSDSNFEGLGIHLREQGIKRVFFIGMNYQAGYDAANGFRRGFQGEPVGEVFTRIDQREFSAELSQLRAANPEAVVYFIPGGNGIAFLKQYAQLGLKDIETYAAVYQVDELTFPAVGDRALGLITSGNWNPNLDNAPNKEFVAAFKKKYGRNPTILGAMSYDTALMLNKAIGDLGGDLSDMDKVRDALRHVKFDSVRGSMRFNQNHFPIQNFYAGKIAKATEGEKAQDPRQHGLHSELIGTLVTDHPDAYHQECKMSWQ